MKRQTVTTPDEKLRWLERRDTWLWIVTLGLVVSQAAAILVLYWPEILGQSDAGGPVAESKGTLAVGLCGLIVLFCLYILNKQNQMRKLRTSLEQETARREVLATRLEELTALFEVATRMNPAVPLDDFLAALLDRLVPGAQAQAGAVFLLDGERENLRCAAAVGHHGFGRLGDLWSAKARPFDAILGGAAALRGETATLGAPGCNAPLGSHSVLLPLAGSRHHGALLLLRTEAAFEEEEASLLRLFASHAGHDIERLTRVVELEEQADRLEDSHRHVTERERQEWQFFTGLNREIREALATIAYRVDACENEVTEVSKPALVDHVAALAAEVRRLSAAVQDGAALLDLEPGLPAVSKSVSPFLPVLEGALHRAISLAGARGVVIETQIASQLPSVDTDAMRLSRTISFYLAELLRRTPEGGSLRVTARAVLGPEISRREVQCEIRRDFDVPWVHSPRSSHLPLYLLRELIDSCGGTSGEIVEPTAQGIRFTLPLTAQQSPAAADPKDIGGPVARAA